jgi:catechol 2,3-dioxygenase-like lactoylglutathione lyase family enzyme
METQELHRGRLIDHIQLVVKDLKASRQFYEPAFKALGLGIGGEGPDFFWIDELFISTKDSKAAQGHYVLKARARTAKLGQINFRVRHLRVGESRYAKYI